MDETAADEEENRWDGSRRLHGARDAVELKYGGEFGFDGDRSWWTPDQQRRLSKWVRIGVGYGLGVGARRRHLYSGAIKSGGTPTVRALPQEASVYTETCLCWTKSGEGGCGLGGNLIF